VGTLAPGPEPVAIFESAVADFCVLRNGVCASRPPGVFVTLVLVVPANGEAINIGRNGASGAADRDNGAGAPLFNNPGEEPGIFGL
jgi:hypothetical protein